MMAVLAEKDVDATIAADWASIREKYKEEAPEIPEPQEEAAPEKSVETKPERARDETGKFVEQPKEAKETKVEVKPSEKAVETAATAESEPPTTTETTQPQRDLNRAPSTWKPTARVEWEKLPAPVRAEIHRREADFLNGQSQLLPDAQFGRSMRQVVDPYRLLIEAEGATPERAVADIMRTAAILRMGTPQQKYAAFAQAAQQHGVDLRAFTQQNESGQPQIPQVLQDPRVDQLLAHMNNQETQRQHQEQSTLESIVTDWMNEADPQGKPLRPYLGDVMTEMQALVPQIRQAKPALAQAQVLQEAYERATWGNPEVRALLQTKQQTDLDAQRRTENQGRVRDAKKAASVNVARRASSPSPAKPGSLEETISNTARELGLIS